MDKTGSAFPFKFNYSDNRMEMDYGLSKRELFAAMALNGLCANPIAIPDDKIAPLTVRFADELIAVLNDSASHSQRDALIAKELLAAAYQARFCLNELLPNNSDAKMTVRMLESAIAIAALKESAHG